MMNKILIVILFSLMTACSNQSVVHAKPTAPVAIEYSVPKNIQPGTEITTSIRFVAMTDMQLLAVSASSYEGLTLISGGHPVEFTNLKRGDSREMEVTIHLDEERGYLAVYASSTATTGKTRSKSITIGYGSAGAATKQKMKSPHYSEQNSGEKLILMPAEDR